MKTKVLFCICAASLAASLMAGCSIFGGESSGSASAKSSSRPDAVSLSGKYDGFGFQALQTVGEMRLYDALDTAVNKLQAEEFVTDSLDDEGRATEVLDFYKSDHPDIFWIDEAQPYYYTVSGNEMTIKLNFKLEGSTLETAKAALDEKVQAALADAPQNGSDYEKELYVHDYIIDCCTYDKESLKVHETETVRANEQNAYGALVDGKAVCEGYTRAFQLLCEKLGVICSTVQGQALGFEGQENTNHIWNCVQLDGNWYYVDATWDDCEDAEAAATVEVDRHMYFNLTTDELKKDHVIAPPYSEYKTGDIWYNCFVPKCDSTDYYYLKLNSIEVDDLDYNGGGAYLAQSAASEAPCCCFMISGDIDFEYAFNEIVQGCAYQWITEANETNENEHQLSENCKLSSRDDRRLVVMILDYN